MNALGTQILLELKDCDQHLLDDIDYVRGTLKRVAHEVGVHVVGESFHKFHPQGVTGILAIAESHISIHTWPEHNYAAVDVFTCGEPDQAHKAAELLIDRFHAGKYTRTILERGPLSRPLSVTGAQR